MTTSPTLRASLLALGCSLFAACGSGDDGTPPNIPAGDHPPVPVITSPALGETFKGGDTVTFTAAATDAEDGVLGSASLSWRADLHHDTHTHPLQLPTAGASGSVTIPTRGETSDNIWYRFHFTATDSDGHSVEVTRDILPLKAQVTLATVPSGLQLTLDGQPVAAAPFVFTGVQGIERDLAAAEQVANGRRYAFANWNDGGAASHTISTPSANATYTATFTDLGPVSNAPPTVLLTAAANGVVGTPVALSAQATDSDGTVSMVQFYDGTTLLGSDSSSPFTFSWTPATAGVHNLTARATDNDGDSTASAGVAVTVTASTGPDNQAPVATLTSPAAYADALSGTITLAATATDNVGVAGVEFQVDGVIVGSEDTSAPYQASWVSGDFPSGQHIVRARARDAAGNLSPWSSATVRINGASLPQGFSKNESWVTGLSSATAFAQAPDGRLFVGQQGGQLRVVKSGVLLATPFTTLTVDSQGERGLIGVALHPDFPNTPWVYLHYTSTSGGAHNRVSRFMANGDVSTGAEQVLFDLPNLSGATNHNGGAIHFGLDGKLYVGVGENANSSNSPNLASPLGKMLRFNEDGSIPTDNPFYNAQTGLARAIWARGLRNPFTFAVEPGTGRIHINDVGQNTWEEINLGTAGADYGWPSTEGNTSAAGITAPLFTYKHSDASPAGSGAGGFFTGFSIAGGAFYPASGPFAAPYRRNYFFADYVTHAVGRLDPANAYAAYAFTSLGGNPVDMLVGADGALYVLTRGNITRITAP